MLNATSYKVNHKHLKEFAALLEQSERDVCLDYLSMTYRSQWNILSEEFETWSDAELIGFVCNLKTVSNLIFLNEWRDFNDKGTDEEGKEKQGT